MSNRKYIGSIALIVMLFFLPAIGFAQQQGYNIKGSIGKLYNGQTIWLTFREGKNYVHDSAIIQSGKYAFSGSLNDGAAATLTLKGQELKFFLRNEAVSITAKDSLQKAVVKGASLNAAYKKYDAYVSNAEEAIASVSRDYRNAPASQQQDAEFRDALDKRYAKAVAEKEAGQLKYIHQNGHPYFSMMALKEMLARAADIPAIEGAFNTLDADTKNSKEGKQLAAEIESAKLTAIGAIAPEFTQNNVDGQPVSLSAYRGKYLLLDFWASWCGPCRAENPNLVKLYETYEHKGFTILGVSLDRPGKHDAWVEAIKADKLVWTQVSDLQFWNNAVAKQYGVKFIPQNLLLDPTGKIIAKNLRGKELAAKLQELFSQ
ncbi:AhpC/TSA family protein [Pseudoflavitalea sp. G-6-1-2]|uniref:TlpA disulfide reductase family protein n=1 Tax=Pseudoflavitalea sp. G-6-1-2 TaxID=2728841 RepID=UPI00146A3814|nr:TlpA disulfide reductase family protein [Pseudoflavitalea sp. G-6-1-2]NML22483.1 AhpC/TSA family protein [Pseudoflavitalea sp. G-6-1-2]